MGRVVISSLDGISMRNMAVVRGFGTEAVRVTQIDSKLRTSVEIRAWSLLDKVKNFPVSQICNICNLEKGIFQLSIWKLWNKVLRVA